MQLSLFFPLTSDQYIRYVLITAGIKGAHSQAIDIPSWSSFIGAH